MDLFSYSRLGKGTLKTKVCLAEKSVEDFRKEILSELRQVSREEVEALDVVLADLRTLMSEGKAGWKALECRNLLNAIVHLWAVGKAAGSDQERRFIDEQKKKPGGKHAPRSMDASRRMLVGSNSHHPRWRSE